MTEPVSAPASPLPPLVPPGPLLEGDGYADAVQRLLAVVRTQLGMQAAWVVEVVGDQHALRFVDVEPGAPAVGAAAWLRTSAVLCARVLGGRLPPLVPDVSAVPEAALLLDASALTIGSYVGVPLYGSPGVAAGMLCAVSSSPSPTLQERDLTVVRLLAELLHDLQSRALSSSDAVEERDQLRRVVVDVIDGAGRHAVLQPVVDLTTGRAVAAEGLTRFTAPSGTGSGRTTAQWFDDAARLGLGQELEVATAVSVLDLLHDPGLPDGMAVAVNLGPSTLVSPAFGRLLAGRPLDRIVVEVTEHAPVHDYATLEAELRPFREAGLRLAVDDAGAGYASLRHVLAVRPDLLKVDMALTRGVDRDPARQTLLRALAGFAEPNGCRLVCEGVETEAELHAVHDCGVDLVQGYYLARPSATPAWSGYPSVTPGDQLPFDAH